MEHGVTILRRRPSTASGPPIRGGSHALPPDLLEKASARVKLVALLILGGDLVTLITGLETDVSGLTYFGGALNLWNTLCAMTFSAALFFVARSGRFSPPFILNLALAFEIVICLQLSLVIPVTIYNEFSPLAVDRPWRDFLPFVTWITPIIIIFPLIVPSAPRRTLVIAIAAAATPALGLRIVELAGLVTADAVTYIKLSISPAIAVAVAYFGSRIVYEIGMDVTRAREMGSYRLEERLGYGGMGEVWRARHRMLARPAAIKLVRPEVLGAAAGGGGDPVALQRFEREAQATAFLRSPHTVELYDFGVAADGTFYYVMELLHGFDLESLVGRFGPVPAPRAVHLLRQVCHSLAEAHDKHLIHRDIKPANIHACRYGREVDFVKVLDFGLVKSRRESAAMDPQLTEAHVAGGTPAYMPPEQVLGDRPVDARTDIYAVGCVAYWLLTGQLVFEGETPMKIMMHHAQTPPVPPSERTELEVPAALDAAIEQCLAKDPADRPQTADALDALLAECAANGAWAPEKARAWWDAHQPHAELESPA